MQIITLTTDWKSNDYYIGAVKGAIYSTCPGVQVVDLAHGIPSFNIRHTSFVLRNTYPHFPPNTIHLVSVMSHEKVNEQGFLIAESSGQYFIIPDSGIISLIFPDGAESVVRVKPTNLSPVFPMMSAYVAAAAKLVQGKKPEEIGTPEATYNKSTIVRATFEANVITGSITHIDTYANVITNISQKLFHKVGKKRSFEIFPGSSHYKVTRISKAYDDVDPGDIFALFNALGLLEIGIFQGNFAELLGLDIHSTIRIHFKDK